MKVLGQFTVLIGLGLWASPLWAQDCPPPPKPEKNTDYQKRTNYCEGINSRQLRDPNNGTPTLVGLTIGTFVSKTINQAMVSFEIPLYSVNQKPQIVLREYSKDYLLNRVELPPQSSQSQIFSWSNKVMKDIRVRAKKLRLKVIYEDKNKKTFYVPARVRKGSRYTFIFRSVSPLVYRSMIIQDSTGKQLSSDGKLGIFQNQEGRFIWDGKSQGKPICTQDIYTGILKYSKEFNDKDIEEFAFAFLHNPTFLGICKP